MVLVRSSAFSAGIVLGACLTVGPAQAQWTVTRLAPAGHESSQAYAVQGGQQTGFVYIGASQHAGLWSGSAGSWVDLHPAGVSGTSVAFDVSGGQQVGRVGASASLWSGTAASWIDLNPAQAGGSVAYGVGDAQQVGQAAIAAGAHASLWSGSAASWVDLNPAGSSESAAYRVSGGQQVGYATLNGAQQASLWTNTAGSWVNLNPASAFGSVALAVNAGQQVGTATVSGAGHASLWSGSAASWVDLNPAGATLSGADGVYGDVQVGEAQFVLGKPHAGLWHGTAASWEDLSVDLPGVGFKADGSWANSIWTDGAFTYVAGWGINASTDQTEALLWTEAIPSPGVVMILSLGSVPAMIRRRR